MDIKDITRQAKETLLQDGWYMPTFYVEREGNQIDMIILDHLEDTTDAKMKQFFKIARGLARGRRWEAKEIREIIFIVEAWVSTYEHGEKPKYARPADDPQRKECLIVSKLTVLPPPAKKHGGRPMLTATMHIIEMLRDGSGDLVDLLSMPEEITECDHRLLNAFLAGIASAEYSELQLAMMARA